MMSDECTDMGLTVDEAIDEYNNSETNILVGLLINESLQGELR